MNRNTFLFSMILTLAPAARAYDSIRFLEPIKGDEMAKPVAAAASGDRLYVVDEKKNMLFLYDASGKRIKNVGRSGSQNGASPASRSHIKSQSHTALSGNGARNAGTPAL